MMGLLDDKSTTMRLAQALKGGILNQWDQGAPYRATLGGLLYGDTRPLMDVMNQKTTVTPMTVGQALSTVMDYAPMGLGTVNKIGKNAGMANKPLWADDLASIGGKLNADGTVTVYHRTSPESANMIRQSGKMKGMEDGLFFSTRPDGQITGYGDEAIALNIPANKLSLDDMFDNELHLRFPTKKAGEEVDISSWLYKKK
jgi:hypothetical protein